jgi:streptomycin 6-kinase
MIFSNKQKEMIIESFGEKLYNKAVRNINIYTEKWQLEQLELVENFACNLLLTCCTEKYGSCVLKISFEDNFDTETEVLRSFDGRGFCRIYEYSNEDEIFLIERISPGNTLFEGTSRDERADFFGDLYSRLYAVPTEPADISIFPSHIYLLEELENNILDNPEQFKSHIEKAKEIILSVNSAYSADFLIHGDLHHDNILKNQDGKYTAIDPTGAIGASVFDIAFFILYEFDNDLTSEPIENILNFIYLLAEKIHIPAEILCKCVYVETVMRLPCDDFFEEQDLEDYDLLIKNMVTVEKILVTV